MKLFARKEEGADADPAEVYLGLRRQVLSLTADPSGASAPPGAPVVAMLMDNGMSNAVATVVGVADGTTSLYYSTGGGVIGAGARHDVATATQRWLRIGAHFLEQLTPIEEPPLPAEGMVQLVAVTPGGLRGVAAPAAELGERSHPLSPLFYAAHGVITQIRLTQAA
jgi:hypothetical protein